ncbi:MAG: isopentenyl-diphosphate Delta-isomerase [Flavobacteriales bacterium]|nr:isopentenyl-diphosphate Delta-isomerase [Flavobacteriales bacterium]
MIGEEKLPNGPEQVILIDPDDRELGHMEKLAAHREGMLHRAFSVFVFNDHGELLLQQRASSKYHSAGLWTNTCCGHPRPGETIQEAAGRRLFEEMGVKIELTPVFHFVYRAELENGLVENELDHVLIGRFSKDPDPDPSEASDWRWVQRESLARELKEYPKLFTAWFPLCVWNAWGHSMAVLPK